LICLKGDTARVTITVEDEGGSRRRGRSVMTRGLQSAVPAPGKPELLSGLPGRWRLRLARQLQGGIRVQVGEFFRPCGVLACAASQLTAARCPFRKPGFDIHCAIPE
jgi:hypothetical protein